MAHGQHTTRRAFLKGAVAAIAVANVAATEAAPLFTAEEALQMRAETVISQYLANGVNWCPQPDGRLFRYVYVDLEEGQTEREAAAVEQLDAKMKANPELRSVVIKLLRRHYGLEI